MRNSTIRSLLAFAMLVLFALSISPKRFLHEFFVHHSDTAVHPSNDGQPHLVKAGFDCDCNSLVANSPFSNHGLPPVFSCFPEHTVKADHFTIRIVPHSKIFFELRGPPVIG